MKSQQVQCDKSIKTILVLLNKNQVYTWCAWEEGAGGIEYMYLHAVVTASLQ